MTLRIRTALPADASLVLGFIRELAEYEREPLAVEATAETLRAQLSSAAPPFECLIAELDGSACGFALFFQSYSTWRGRPGLYLEDLFVSESQRGRGVGKALLSRVARIAVERGCARLEWAVLDWNQPAIDFYRALGAVPMAEWTVFRLTGDALTQVAGG
ncbi:MAG: GNAT family N-acetyltransferase [Myxococcales bacterium]|nr:GNAT family N-acetyltransferase [Myxococcales bacterium]